MVRPALGSAARVKVASTRVTNVEAEFLIAKYGSLTNALRHYINEDIKQSKGDQKK